MNKTDLHKIVREELNSILNEKKTDYSKRRSGVKPKGNDYFKRRKKLKEETRNMYEELSTIVHDNSGNLGDVVDVVYEWINKNYKEISLVH